MNWTQIVITQVALAIEAGDIAAFRKWEAIRRQQLRARKEPPTKTQQAGTETRV